MPSARRMSLTAAIQAFAASSVSSNRPPSSGTVSSSCCAATRLASMISGSCRLRSAAFRLSGGLRRHRRPASRSPAAAAAASHCQGGSELPVFMPVICSSSSGGEDDSRSSSSPIIEPTRFLSKAASCESRADRKRGPSAVSTRFHLRTCRTRMPRLSGPAAWWPTTRPHAAWTRRSPWIPGCPPTPLLCLRCGPAASAWWRAARCSRTASGRHTSRSSSG